MTRSPQRHSQHRHQSGFQWPTRNLWQDVTDRASRTPDKTAVIDESGSVTLAELVEAVMRLSEGYRERGVGHGDVVAVQLPPIREFVSAFLAAERLGAVVCPMLPSIDGMGAHELLRLSRARLVVTIDRHGRSAPAASLASYEGAVKPELLVVGEPPPGTVSIEEAMVTPRSEIGATDAYSGMDDVAELAFTSGTTGRPKGAEHSHGTATAGILSTLYRQKISSRDVVHVALPVGHNFGYFYGVRLALHAGATLVLQRAWDADEMLDITARLGVTISSGPPTLLADLLSIRKHWGGMLDGLRLFTCGGAKLRTELAEEVIATMPGRLSKAFGMTEVGHTCSTGPDSDPSKLVGTEGAPHPEIEMRILDPEGRELGVSEIGSIAFRGPFLFLGYRRRDGSLERPFDTGGFFATGDLGYRDEDGYLVVTGRTKNVVIRGGENIPTELVETVVERHPAVVQAVVVGVPDVRLGERAVVCVQVIRGAELALEQIVEHMSVSGVPRVHWPEALVVLSSIPQSDTGKIKRAELKRMVADMGPFTEEAEYD